MKKMICMVMLLTLTAGGLAGVIGVFSPLNSAQEYVNEETKYQTTEYARGGTYLGEIEETVNYAYKQEDVFVHNPVIPGYGSGYTCGIIAGGNIIAWYNRLFPQLIPGHTAGMSLFGTYFWAAENALLGAMFAQLNSDMNGSPLGVTISDYLGGMSTYASRKSCIFTSANVMGTGGAVINDGYKAQMQSGKLLTVFMYGFNFIDGSNGFNSSPAQGYDEVIIELYGGAHVMVAYGYREIKYFNAQNEQFRKDIYLYVHTGTGSALGLLRLTSHITLDDAYISHITA